MTKASADTINTNELTDMDRRESNPQYSSIDDGSNRDSQKKKGSSKKHIHSTDLVPYTDANGETDAKKIYHILETQNKQQQEMIDLLKKQLAQRDEQIDLLKRAYGIEDGTSKPNMKSMKTP